MSWLEFTGMLMPGTQYVHVDVELRGEKVGELQLDLDQWDDLRGMRDKRDLTWLNVLARDSKAEAAT